MFLFYWFAHGNLHVLLVLCYCAICNRARVFSTLFGSHGVRVYYVECLRLSTLVTCVVVMTSQSSLPPPSAPVFIAILACRLSLTRQRAPTTALIHFLSSFTVLFIERTLRLALAELSLVFSYCFSPLHFSFSHSFLVTLLSLVLSVRYYMSGSPFQHSSGCSCLSNSRSI